MQPAVRRGDTVRVDVVVRTKKVGHFFPGGTVDAYDTWLELKATDDKNQTIFWSGMVEDNGKGPVEKGAHFYRSLQIDAHGNPINKRNAWATRAVVYVHLIPPGAADTVHYRMHIPESAGNKITLHARLLLSQVCLVEHAVFVCRNSRPQQAQAGDDARLRRQHVVFTGPLQGLSAKEQKIPDVPIVAVAENEVTLERCAAQRRLRRSRRLTCTPKTGSAGTTTASACCCKAILKGAEAAFRKSTRDRSQES